MLRHQAGNEGHVARGAIKLGNQHRTLRLARCTLKPPGARAEQSSRSERAGERSISFPLTFISSRDMAVRLPIAQGPRW
jgi:hypothetical protein